MALFFVGCTTGDFPHSRACSHELLQHTYDRTFVPWHELFYGNEDILSCSEWFIVVKMWYLDHTPLQDNNYVPIEDVICYLYDEGTDRIYPLIFGE